MTLTKSIKQHVEFAIFAFKQNIDPTKLGELCQLVKRRAAKAAKVLKAKNMPEEQLTKEDGIDENLISQICERCKRFGWTAVYESYALYPTITRSKDYPIKLPIEYSQTAD